VQRQVGQAGVLRGAARLRSSARARRRCRSNAGSNTVADHVTVLRQALTQLPAGRRPGKNVLIRVDGASGTHELIAWLTRCRLSYFVGFCLPGDLASIQAKLATIPEHGWEPGYDAD
jgi:hypothetical protein